MINNLRKAIPTTPMIRSVFMNKGYRSMCSMNNANNTNNTNNANNADNTGKAKKFDVKVEKILDINSILLSFFIVFSGPFIYYQEKINYYREKTKIKKDFYDHKIRKKIEIKDLME